MGCRDNKLRHMNQYLKFILVLALIAAIFVVMVLSLQSEAKSMEMAIGPWRIATTPLR